MESSSNVCRASLALNNAGVSFLERGYYPEAIVAFKDSLATMRALMSNTGNISLEQTIEQKLHACNTKLACMHNRKNKLSSSSPRGSIDHDILGIIPIDDGDVASMQAALSTTPKAVFPIRLRFEAFEKNLELQAATVFYNVGVAHVVVDANNNNNHASSSSSALQRSKTLLATSALRNLSMAHSLYSRNIYHNSANKSRIQKDGDEQQGQGESAHQRLCAMLVSGLVLKNMLRLFQSQKQLIKAQQVVASLAMLEAAMDDAASGLLVHHDVVTTMQQSMVSPAA
jgi:hypothetical protein